jgi:hypothetical protein
MILALYARTLRVFLMYTKAVKRINHAEDQKDCKSKYRFPSITYKPTYGMRNNRHELRWLFHAPLPAVGYTQHHFRQVYLLVVLLLLNHITVLDVLPLAL